MWASDPQQLQILRSREPRLARENQNTSVKQFPKSSQQGKPSKKLSDHSLECAEFSPVLHTTTTLLSPTTYSIAKQSVLMENCPTQTDLGVLFFVFHMPSYLNTLESFADPNCVPSDQHLCFCGKEINTSSTVWFLWDSCWGVTSQE